MAGVAVAAVWLVIQKQGAQDFLKPQECARPSRRPTDPAVGHQAGSTRAVG